MTTAKRAKKPRTPRMRWPSQCREIEDLEVRKSAYHRAVFVTKAWQDSLETRIAAGVPLSETDIDALVALFGERCRAGTKVILRVRLESVPRIPSFGIFGRVILHDDGVSYCAGQDYPREIAIVRKLLIEGK